MNRQQRFSIPGYPVISPANFRNCSVEEGVCTFPIIEGRRPLYVTSGRIALAVILKEIGVTAGSKVLIPAYNCVSMVLPVTFLGGSPVFYRVNRDLSPNVEDLENKIDKDVKCIVIAHYFGFPQKIESLVEIASRHSLKMIEDCAHAFFGTYKNQSLGSFGDYAICSPWKFLPLFDGGCILSRDDELTNKSLVGGSAMFQVKALSNTIETSLAAGRFGFLNGILRIPFSLKDWLLRAAKRNRLVDLDGAAPISAQGSSEFEAKWMYVRMSRWSHWIMRHVSLSRVVHKRRQNYRKMLAAFSGNERCRPLYPELPENVVPYVFPLYVTDGDAVYGRLRMMNVPVFRWDDIPDNVCETSTEYQSRLIQLPIHQELSATELERLIHAVKDALGEGYRPASKLQDEHDL